MAWKPHRAFDKGDLIGYLYLFEYSSCTIVEIEVWEHDYRIASENLEQVIVNKGYNLDSVSYMFSGDKLTIESDTN